MCQKIVGSIEGTLNSLSPEGRQIKKKKTASVAMRVKFVKKFATRPTSSK